MEIKKNILHCRLNGGIECQYDEAISIRFIQEQKTTQPYWIEKLKLRGLEFIGIGYISKVNDVKLSAGEECLFFKKENSKKKIK